MIEHEERCELILVFEDHDAGLKSWVDLKNLLRPTGIEVASTWYCKSPVFDDMSEAGFEFETKSDMDTARKLFRSQKEFYG